MESTDTKKKPHYEGGSHSHEGHRHERHEKSEGGRSFHSRKRRPPKDLKFDYKEVETLKRFVSDEGKIIPARISRLNAKQQRELTQAIKRARHLAMLPCGPAHLE